MKIVMGFVTKINKIRKKFNPCLSPSLKFKKQEKLLQQLVYKSTVDKKKKM